MGGGLLKLCRASVGPQLRVELLAGCRAHPEVSLGTRVVVGGRELGFCSLPRESLGLGLPAWEVGRLGGGPRLTQQCLGAGWESLILPGNDGGPRPCVSDRPLPQAPAGCSPPRLALPHTPESPSCGLEGAANKVALGWRVAHWTQWF